MMNTSDISKKKASKMGAGMDMGDMGMEENTEENNPVDDFDDVQTKLMGLGAEELASICVDLAKKGGVSADELSSMADDATPEPENIEEMPV